MSKILALFPFYEKARNLWQNTQANQIAKGLKKYPEPFNPHNWSADQLLTHALEESVDLVHYLVGLKELLDEKDREIERLSILLTLSLETNKKPPYADLDDE